MKKLDLDWYKILHHFTIGVDVLFAFLLLFNFLNYLPEFWNIRYIFYVVVAINTGFLAFKMNKIPEDKRKDSKMIYYFSHFFLLSLVVITINQFLKRQFIIDFMPEITAFAIGLGFLTFYAYRNKVEKEIEEEKVSEEKAEKKRFDEFGDKFPRLNKIPVLRRFVRWMYKEGWVYSILFVLIIILFLGVRLYSMDYIDGSDNYNDVAIKALYENGHSFYNYSLISTKLMLLSVNIFGFNFAALKLPFILYSLITIIFIYFIAKFINKKVALLSMFLFAISPWSIILSKVTRDYSFDCMMGVIVLYLCLLLYQKSKEGDFKKNLINLIYLFSLVIFIYGISELNHRANTLILLIFPFIIGIFMTYEIIKDNLKINSRFRQGIRVLYFPIILFILIICFYFIAYFPFMRGYSFDKFYFYVFFNSLAESPWQWFQGNALSILLIFSFFLLPILFNFLKCKKQEIINILYSIFFFGLVLYLFKYKSHVEYNPTRYVYFLFPIYCILFSLSLFYYLRNYSEINFKNLFAILIIILLFFNFTSFYYSVDPIKAYEKEGISDLKIDNVGVGRFDMYEVINFIRDKDPLLNDIYVVSGRFDEFILLLNWPIDKNRKVVSHEGQQYDIGRNMFVESEYFSIHELPSALRTFPDGYFITEEYSLYLEEGVENILKEEDIIYGGVPMKFIKSFGNYKIYKWEI
tara:strand:- start:4433 stop:6508 length:2076 start_codon:yes stop_codon:yes gene_type:complete